MSWKDWSEQNQSEDQGQTGSLADPRNAGQSLPASGSAPRLTCRNGTGESTRSDGRSVERPDTSPGLAPTPVLTHDPTTGGQS